MKKIFLLAAITLFTNGMAQWTQTSGPYGASISALLSQNDTIFAGTSGGGVYFSDNNGATWTKRSSGISSPNAYSFYRQGGDIFVGTSDRIFKSTNYGVSWTQLTAGWTANIHVMSIQSNGSNMFACGDNGSVNGVFTSTNNGASWSAVMTNTNIGSLAVIGTDVYASGNGSGIEVFKSVNNGITWTNVNSNIPVGSGNVNVLFADGTDLYAGTSNGGICKTSNAAATWTTVNTGVSTFQSIISFAKNGSDIYAGTLGGIIYKTSNAGASWTTVNTGLPGTDISVLCGNGSKVFAGTYRAGIFETINNGALWTDASAGIYSPVFALGIQGASLFAGTDGAGVFYSSNKGASYAAKTPVGLGQRITNIYFDSSRVLAAFDGNGTRGLHSSSNNGNTWTLKNSSFSSRAVYATLINSTDWFAGTNQNGVYKSNNSASTWTASSTGIPANIGVYSLAQDATGIYAGCFTGGVYKSTNNGASWSVTGTGPSGTVYSIVIDGTSIYAGTTSGVYLSTNGGTSWTAINTGLGSSFVYALALNGSDLYAGTFSGIYKLPASSSSWVNISLGLPASSTIRSLALDGTDIYVGTMSSGVWRTSLSALSVNGSAKAKEEEMNIYPNPNNGLFNITSSAPFTEVKVYNQLGALVITKETEGLNTSIDISSAAKGIYFYRVMNKNEIMKTGKIVVE